MGKGVKIAVGKSYVGGDIGIEYEDSFEITTWWCWQQIRMTTNMEDLIPTGNFHFVRASVPERLALPASNVAVGSVFNLDFPILYVLHGNKELILSTILDYTILYYTILY